jgi:hypothetical protein
MGVEVYIDDDNIGWNIVDTNGTDSIRGILKCRVESLECRVVEKV